MYNTMTKIVRIDSLLKRTDSLRRAVEQSPDFNDIQREHLIQRINDAGQQLRRLKTTEQFNDARERQTAPLQTKTLGLDPRREGVNHKGRQSPSDAPQRMDGVYRYTSGTGSASTGRTERGGRS